MANSKISALGAAAAVATAEVLPLVQGGVTKKATVGQMANYVGNNLVLPITSGSGIKINQAAAQYAWRDIIGTITPKATGTGAPARAAYRGNLYQYAFALNDVVDMEFHLPHDYAPGTDLFYHVHWSHNGTSVSGDAVFTAYHSYAKGHKQAIFPAEKTIALTYTTTNIATTPQYEHMITEAAISDATPSASLMDKALIEVDGLLLVTLKLTGIPTIGGSGKLFIHQADIHYQSTNVGTASKAPDFYAVA